MQIYHKLKIKAIYILTQIEHLQKWRTKVKKVKVNLYMHGKTMLKYTNVVNCSTSVWDSAMELKNLTGNTNFFPNSKEGLILLTRPF